MQFTRGRDFVLESGETLQAPVLAYETWGTLDDTASNAVLVCHALTGDSHAASHPKPHHHLSDEGWWERVVGPGKTIDTNRYFVVCANVLGGCQGSSGPASTNPSTAKRYGPDFPQVSVRDQVRAQAKLAEELGVESWLGVVGGSMGGMQALEWAVTFPDRVRSVAALATTAAASAQQIAWSQAGRMAVMADSGWNSGHYYDAAPGHGPHRGLATARVLAMIHYRSDLEFNARFGRLSSHGRPAAEHGAMFDIERYLAYQGSKFVRRFDANSYILLNRMMDLHDLGRGRGGVAAALSRVKCPLFTASVSTDFLYPEYQQRELVEGFEAAGQWATHVMIEADTGHDGFLTHGDQVEPQLQAFLDKIASDG
ncbi:MAG: homoserine O-acetyltransferase [Acidimicrobiales bacterium]